MIKKIYYSQRWNSFIGAWRRTFLILVLGGYCFPASAVDQQPIFSDSTAAPSVTFSVEDTTNSVVDIRRIVELYAPTLWYSDAEEEFITRIPEPGERQDWPPGILMHPTVYYQASFSEEKEMPTNFKISYFFFYRRDYGFGEHKFDIEQADFLFDVQAISTGKWTVRLHAVRCDAHGHEFYANTLTISQNVKYPITILVEEGKHATCPDRDSDGQIHMGYDVTENTHDAWGIRDVISVGHITQPRFRSSMVKKRSEKRKISWSGIYDSATEKSVVSEEEKWLRGYKLVSTSDISNKIDGKLRGKLAEQNFGIYRDAWWKRFINVGKWQLRYRWDQGHQLSLSRPVAEVGFLGWGVLKVLIDQNTIKGVQKFIFRKPIIAQDQSISLLLGLSQSGARLSDFYFYGGVKSVRNISLSDSYRFVGQIEAGSTIIRFTLPSTGLMLGLKAGIIYEVSKNLELSQPRLAAEFGMGLF